MNAMPTIYSFDDRPVRVAIDEEGNPWFNANDVCDVLGYANPRDAVAKHVDPEDVAKRDTLSSGGTQQSNHINESGVYRLVFGSTKEEAKRFKRWLTSEVLPAIRKTGSYTTPQAAARSPSVHDKTSALMRVGYWMEKIPGIDPGVLAAAVLTAINVNTGLDMNAMRKALPGRTEPTASLTPTKIGEALGGMSAKAVNKRLMELGVQIKNDRGEWELTTSGCEFGEALPYSRNGHAGYQVMWKPNVVEFIRASMIVA